VSLFSAKYVAQQTFKGQVNEDWFCNMVVQFYPNSAKFLIWEGKYSDLPISYLLLFCCLQWEFDGSLSPGISQEFCML